MSPTVKKVFLLIGVLVLCFLIWDIFFRTNGLVQTSYNAVVGVVNDTWQDITGGSTNIVPEWNTDKTGDSLKTSR